MSDESKFTQADIDAAVARRLGEQKAKYEVQLGEVKAQLAERDQKIGALTPLAERAEKAEQELATTLEAGVRSEAFRAVGLDSEDAAGKRDRLMAYHRGMAPVGEDGQPIPFPTWLRDHAPTDELVGGLLKAPGAAAAGGGQPNDTQAGAGGAAASRPASGAVHGAAAAGGRGLGVAPTPGQRLTHAQITAEHAKLLGSGKTKEAGEFLRAHLTGQQS